MRDQSVTILVVDDEVDVADSFAKILSDRYEIRTVYDGEAALEHYDEDVDVVLLDRRMPDMTGDEVLERIQECPHSSRVAMVTAVEPDFDIIDLGFDDYLTKPVTRDDLVTTIEKLRARSTYEEEIQDYFSLLTKKATLEMEMGMIDLENSKEYRDLQDEIEAHATELDDIVENLSMDDYRAVLRDLERGE